MLLAGLTGCATCVKPVAPPTNVEVEPAPVVFFYGSAYAPVWNP
jgi:hypothetical protein